MGKKQPLKQGEKILFGIFGAFLGLAVLAYALLEIVRLKSEEPMFQSKTSYALSEQGKLGSKLFRERRCTACHRAMRNGTNMGLNLSPYTRSWISSKGSGLCCGPPRERAPSHRRLFVGIEIGEGLRFGMGASGG